MDNFKHFLLTEWKLPQIGGIVDTLIGKGYIQKIIDRAPRSLKTGQAIRIGSFEYTNPYNQQREAVDIRVVYEPNSHKMGVAQLNKMREDITYWFVLFNWPAIMRAHRKNGKPIRQVVEGVLRHEILHTIDPRARYTDSKIGVFQPTEISAFLDGIVFDIERALQQKQIDLEDIRNQIAKPADLLIKWIAMITGSNGKTLKQYNVVEPDVIQRLRKVLYDKFFNRPEVPAQTSL